MKQREVLSAAWHNTTVKRLRMARITNSVWGRVRLKGFTYIVTAEVNSIFGRTSFPVFGSIGGRISNTASTLAIASQSAESAK